MPRQIKKVLISDSDQDLLLSCANHFQLFGVRAIAIPKHGRELWDAIEKEQPDAVLCNVFMAYCDVVHIMESLRKENSVPFPLFIALSSSDNERLFERFLSAGGSHVFVKPFDIRILVEQTVHYLEQQDAKNNVCKVDFSGPAFDVSSAISETLKDIGMPAHLSGYHYIKTGILLLYDHPELFSHSTRGLYQAIAQQTHSTYSCVERNIRTAVEVAFSRGDLDVFEEIFGYSVNRKTGKPNNV